MKVSGVNENVYKPKYTTKNYQVNFCSNNLSKDTFERQINELTTDNNGFDFAKSIKKLKEKLFSLYCMVKPELTLKTEKEKYIKSVYTDIVKELGIPKKLQPKLHIKTFKPEMNMFAGLYESQTHCILANTDNEVIDIENILMHEMTHCKERIKRAGIPQARAEEIVKNELITRIKEGATENVLVTTIKDNYILMQPPLFSSEMKSDFINFANEYLYKPKYELSEALENHYAQNLGFSDLILLMDNGQLDKNEEEILNKVIELNLLHPEFKLQYENEEEAINALFNFAISNQERYTAFTNTKIRNNEGNVIKIRDLKGKELKEAEKSLINYIKLVETTNRIASGDISLSNLIQYSFNNEEVSAQINGNSYLIKCLNKKLNELQGKGDISKETALKEKLYNAKRTIEIIKEGQLLLAVGNNIPEEEFQSKMLELLSELEQLQSQSNVETINIEDEPVYIQQKLIEQEQKK